MAWMEVHQELVRHRKTKRLARLLEISRPQAVGHMVFLWAWAYDHAPDGCIERFDVEEIAEEAGWEGEPLRFVEALHEASFVDADGTFHDWEEYAGRLLSKREANRERARTARMAYRATLPNPTEPDPTQPNQTDPTEQNQLLETAPSAASKQNAGQVPDRWPYFLARLYDGDKAWLPVTLPACRRLAAQTSVEAVTTALGFASQNPPKIQSSAMGWLSRTARRVHAGQPIEAVA